MVILIDANVLLNYLLQREPGYKYAQFVLQKCAEDKVHGYMAFHSISILWYVLRRLPDSERRSILKNVLEIVKIAGASHDEVKNALDKIAFKDFEDCLQDLCATSIRADFLITDNIKDFANASTEVISSEDFYKRFA